MRRVLLVASLLLLVPPAALAHSPRARALCGTIREAEQHHQLAPGVYGARGQGSSCYNRVFLLRLCYGGPALPPG